MVKTELHVRKFCILMQLKKQKYCLTCVEKSGQIIYYIRYKISGVLYSSFSSFRDFFERRCFIRHNSVF